MPSRSLALAVAVACAVGTPLFAQSRDAVPGARIRYRVEPRGEREKGQVMERAGDTLVVATSDSATRRLSRASLAELDVRKGRSHLVGMGKGALWGAAVGAGFTTVLYLTGGKMSVNNSDEYVALTVAFSTIFGIFGAPIGLLVGSERWERLPAAPRVGVAPAPRGAALTLTWRR